MSVATMRAVELPSGDTMPVLGLGTWHLGEGRHPPQVEIDALRTGLDLGMALVDTAEMYGDGATETLVGRAIAGRRAGVFLVSKVMPHHATFDGTIAACEGSLRRLATDRLDLYLLHRDATSAAAMKRRSHGTLSTRTFRTTLPSRYSTGPAASATSAAPCRGRLGGAITSSLPTAATMIPATSRMYR
jgi:diketogulonate reductase-like aldo/keto reductase